MSKKRPFKIWSENEELKKCVMASSIEEIIYFAKQKLNIDSATSVTVHLADDTEVDDDDYLQCLDDHEVLYVRRVATPTLAAAANAEVDPVIVASQDTTDCASAPTMSHQEHLQRPLNPTSKQLQFKKELRLFNEIKKSLGYLMAMDNEEMKILTNYDVNDLSRKINKNHDFCDHLQMSLQRRLDDDLMNKEAKEYINLLKDGVSTSKKTKLT